MIYKDNDYTHHMAHLTSSMCKKQLGNNKPLFFVGETIISGFVVPDDDPKLLADKESDNSNPLFDIAAASINIRTKDAKEELSVEEIFTIEPTYLYLEDVTITSLASGNKTNLPAFALRISSIDGLSAGSLT